MSFLAIRDLSLITTPPVDRLAIRTTVTKFDEEVIREAIMRELQRGGQVFFVHNRVQSNASPEKVERLSVVMVLKRRLVALGAIALDGALNPSGGGRLALAFDQGAPIDRARLVDLAQSSPERARLTPDGNPCRSYCRTSYAPGA